MRKLALVAVLFAPAVAAAQSTGTPVFAAPYRAFTTSEVGVSLSEPSNGTALEAFYKTGHQKWDIGFRGGFWDIGSGSNSTVILLGVDGRTRVLTHNQSFPLDGALTLGAGANLVNSANVFMVPVGLSLGRRVDLEGSQVSFVPYFQPVLTPTFGSGTSDVFFSVGLGADVKLNKSADLRVAGALGDMSGVSVSFAWLR